MAQAPGNEKAVGRNTQRGVMMEALPAPPFVVRQANLLLELLIVPNDATPEQLVIVTKMRWRIERDYQELKQEFGLSHYEGRGWQGFHHHATLSIAAYGFLVARRLGHGGPKKNAARPKTPALPENYVPRGSSSISTR